MEKPTRLGLAGLQSEAKHTAGWLELSFTGEVDFATVPVMQEALDRCFETQPERLVIDLSRTHFLGAAGILLLFKARRRCRRDAIEFRIRLSDAAERTLHLCCRVPGDIGALSRALQSHQIDGALRSGCKTRAKDGLVSFPHSMDLATEGRRDRFVVDWAPPLTHTGGIPVKTK